MKSTTLALLAAALVVVPSSAQAQEKVDGQYIVVLKSGASTTAVDRAKDKARDRGGRVQRTYGKVLKGFSAKLTKQALVAVKKDPAVAFVEQDRVIRLDATQNNAPWGLDRIDQRALPLSTTYNYTGTGAGVKAFIIDTGVRITHTDFGGRATSGFDAVDGGAADDCHGHGTHVAGTVGGTTHGVAKAVSIVAVRVLDCAGSGTISGVVAGVNWVTQNHGSGPAVANMSLGGGASDALDQAVAASVASGVTYAVASGNSGDDACDYSPARTPTAITVNSSNRTDARSSFSNYGTCSDIFAPGEQVLSTWNTSDTATSTLSGTSMASPHVAGAAAVYLQTNTSATPAQVATALTTAATSGVITSPGTGSPNKLLYSDPGGGGGNPNPEPTPTPTPSPTPSPTPTPSPSPSPTPTPTPAPGCGDRSSSGSLSGRGAEVRIEYATTASGLHKACLTGASGTDFDLALQRQTAYGWQQVAISQSPFNTETVEYSGPAGQYRWRVYSYSGTGGFTLSWRRP
ncbi:S8 family peptidase [Solirubrobacter taibaiensis]|nr:S8 family peptidase [Solirubrobacter taibaiensis]